MANKKYNNVGKKFTKIGVSLIVAGLATISITTIQDFRDLEIKNEVLESRIEADSNKLKKIEEARDRLELECETKDVEIEKKDKKINESNMEVEELKKEYNSLIKAKKDEDKANSQPSRQSVVVASRGGTGGVVSGGRTMQATAYDLSVASCGKSPSHPQYGITASGASLRGKSRSSAMAVAADPRVFPMGTRLQISFGSGFEHMNGVYTVLDKGGAIKGNRIDVFMGSGNVSQDVRNFGRRSITVKVVS